MKFISNNSKELRLIDSVCVIERDFVDNIDSMLLQMQAAMNDRYDEDWNSLLSDNKREYSRFVRFLFDSRGKVLKSLVEMLK
jgi:hypothetical protein